MNKAVLFLVFNRLDCTKKVFEQIQEAKPPRLYIASDGARQSKDGEAEIVQSVRDYLVQNINWPCEVKTRFNEQNLGCGRAVSSAITWFFDNEEDGIILEDDCLPHPSFFSYCEQLLDYYHDDEQVMHISGNQFVDEYKSKASYYFSPVMHCWGWASWAKSWKNYSFDLTDFDESKLVNLSKNPFVQQYWRNILHKVQAQKIDTWDYQWTFKMIENNGICINPAKNLISNIGFDREDATHTRSSSPFANMKVFPIDKVRHPPTQVLDQKAIEYIYKHHFKIKTELEPEPIMIVYLRRIKIKLMTICKNIFSKEIEQKNFVSEDRMIFEKYRRKERFVPEIVNYKGLDLYVPDVVSFAYQVKEIFIQNIYKFEADTDEPVVYDCGANIGMSVIYIKNIYPKARIVAFEPDKKVCSSLRKNVSHLCNIDIKEKAVWVKDEVLVFNSEGADGGSLSGEMNNSIEVEAVRFRDILELEKSIDFLKIDIEGPEVDVINDCANSLSHVKNIFIEYHSFKNQEQGLDRILLILKKAGFRYYTDTIKCPKEPFVGLPEDQHQMDYQVNVFGIRVE